MEPRHFPQSFKFKAFYSRMDCRLKEFERLQDANVTLRPEVLKELFAEIEGAIAKSETFEQAERIKDLLYRCRNVLSRNQVLMIIYPINRD
jgi:hypothetical protein